MSAPALAIGDVSDDGFLGGRIRVLQPKRGFRAAIDSVLLPAAVEADNGLDILDAGLGAGVASLCLLARHPQFRVTGVEREAELAALATENARRNGFALDVQCADLIAWRCPRAFDQVMTNPPYFELGTGTQSPLDAKARANVQEAGLAAWISACLSCLNPGGVLTIIHRAECEADILSALGTMAGGTEILPLLPRAGGAPKRILVRARKGAASSIRRCPGFVLHGAETKYTEDAESVLRQGAPLRWGR